MQRQGQHRFPRLGVEAFEHVSVGSVVARWCAVHEREEPLQASGRPCCKDVEQIFGADPIWWTGELSLFLPLSL